MTTKSFYRKTVARLVAAPVMGPAAAPALGCTRALYVAAGGTVIIGRSMDWGEDLEVRHVALTRGMKRDGRGGRNTISWESK